MLSVVELRNWSVDELDRDSHLSTLRDRQTARSSGCLIHPYTDDGPLSACLLATRNTGQCHWFKKSSCYDVLTWTVTDFGFLPRDAIRRARYCYGKLSVRDVEIS